MKLMDVRSNGVSIDYEYLGQKGSLRPGEELPFGVGYLQVFSEKGGRIGVRRLSGGRNETYALILRTGETYRLGARYGHRVRRPDKEQDPIIRVLREEGVPVSHLVRMKAGETLEYTDRIRDISRFSRPVSMSRWHSDGFAILGEKTIIREYPGTHCFPDSESDGVIHDATWAIQETIGTTLGGGLSREITRIHVWEGCEPETLRQALRDIRGGIRHSPEPVNLIKR